MSLKKTIATGISLYSLVLSDAALADESLRFPLTSTADVDTTLDREKAARARKLAEYVITRDKQRELLLYHPDNTGGNPDYQGVQAVIDVGDWRYTVWVANHDENNSLKMPDNISFWMRPKGTSGQDTLITFSDRGLDGSCDFGVIGKGVSDTKQEIIYHAKEMVGQNGENLQHRKQFQKLYNETVDKLLAFYERK